MSKVSSPTERRDAFEGFLLAIHANPQSLEPSSPNGVVKVSSIVSAVISWHYPLDGTSSWGEEQYYGFETKVEKVLQPFPSHSSDLASALQGLLQQLKASLPPERWNEAINHLSANERRMLQQLYGI